MTPAQLYRAALAADRAWQAELQRQFGNDAGTKRYQRAGKGEPGSTLRALHDAFREANDTWLAKFRELTVGP